MGGKALQRASGSLRLKVLIVEDNPDDALLMVEQLLAAGIAFTHQVVEEEEAFVHALDAGVDLVLCDHTLPRFSGRRAFEILQERGLHVPVIIVSGTLTDELALEFLRRGASDYVLKDGMVRLGPAVRNALERFRYEHDAMVANQRIVDLMDEVGVMAMATDLEGCMLEANGVAARVLGYPSVAALKAVPAADHYVNRNQRQELLRLLDRDGKVTGYELQLKRADGSRIWTLGEYRAVKGDDGRVERVDALLTDTTNRKRAEREADASRSRLDSALRGLPVIFATYDQELICTFVGGTSMALVGIVPKDVIGRPAEQQLAGRPEWIAAIKTAATGVETSIEGEYAGRFFHITLTPTPGEQPDTHGVALVAVDITLRHEAELMVQARARQQAAVRQLAQEALNEAPIPLLLHRAARLAAAGMDAAMSSVHELEPGGRSLRTIASVAYKEPAERIPMAPGGLAETAMKTGGVSFIEDVDSSDSPSAPAIKPLGIKAAITGVIGDGQHTFGFISAQRKHPHRWTDDEKEFIQLVAQTLWIAIDKANIEKQRKQLVSRLVDAQEQERQRIAADVHDDAVQVMSAALMRLSLLARHISDPDQVAMAAKLQSTVSLSIERLRHLLFELSPPALERGGLMAALKTLLDEFKHDFGILTTLSGGLAADPDTATSLVIYRIIQEALTNVHKHAQASRVEVTLREADGGLLARVQDDGVGFDMAQPHPEGTKHIGLSSMRERAELAEGWWNVVSGGGTGTRVEFWIPMPSSSAELTGT